MFYSLKKIENLLLLHVKERESINILMMYVSFSTIAIKKNLIKGHCNNFDGWGWCYLLTHAY